MTHNPIIDGSSSSNIGGGAATAALAYGPSLPPPIDVLHPHPPRKATLLSCYINLSNTILGSGILGLPYAFRYIYVKLYASLSDLLSKIVSIFLHTTMNICMYVCMYMPH